MEDTKIHEVCKCDDVKPEDYRWLGPFVVIVGDVAYPFLGDIQSAIEHGGTSIYHAKCGRAVNSSLLPEWVKENRIPKMQSIIKEFD